MYMYTHNYIWREIMLNTCSNDQQSKHMTLKEEVFFITDTNLLLQGVNPLLGIIIILGWL